METTIDEQIFESNFKGLGLIDQICESLTCSILNGKLRGGQQLKEVELQNCFHVSRSPIREAFRELEKRGLVAIKPRRGTFVKKVTLEEIKQNFAVRTVLEGLAAREAYFLMTNEDLEKLKKEFLRIKKATATKDSGSFIKGVISFHKTFIICSNNQSIINCLRNLPVHVLWDRFMRSYTTEEMGKTLRRHEKVLNLFLDNESKPKQIELAVKEQLESSITRLAHYLESGNVLDP